MFFVPLLHCVFHSHVVPHSICDLYGTVALKLYMQFDILPVEGEGSAAKSFSNICRRLQHVVIHLLCESQTNPTKKLVSRVILIIERERERSIERISERETSRARASLSATSGNRR